jgi:4-amino-4-deoxy-L-arabinose transferase-like glycosyltransferase
VLSLGAFSAFLLLRHLGDDSLRGDEATYAQITHETRAAGPWLPLLRQGEIALNKPPLGFFLQRASFAALDESELAARLPSALAGLATVLLLALWGAPRMGAAGAGLAALLYVTTPLALGRHALRGGTFDALLALLVLAAILVHIDRLESVPLRGFLPVVLIVALATLVKTLAAAVLCAAAVLAVEILAGPPGLGPRQRAIRAAGRAFALLLTGSAVLALWILLLRALGADDAAHRLVSWDLLERSLRTVHADHAAPWSFYLGRAARDFGIFLLAPAAALWLLARRRRSGAEPLALDRLALRLAIAAGAMVATLSLSASKRDWYALTPAPLVAAAIGAGAAAWLAPSRRPARAALVVIGLALLVPRLDWALRRTATPPRRTALHRLELAARAERAGLWVEPGLDPFADGPAAGGYAWNERASNGYYLTASRRRRSGWPPARDSCAVALLVRTPERQADWDALATLPADEGGFTIAEACGGRVLERLGELAPADAAQTSDSR